MCDPESAHKTPPLIPSPNPKLSRINCKLQLYRLWFNPTWKQGVDICAQRGVHVFVVCFYMLLTTFDLNCGYSRANFYLKNLKKKEKRRVPPSL